MYKVLGGGNFAQAKLAQYHHVLIRSKRLRVYTLHNSKKAVTTD